MSTDFLGPNEAPEETGDITPWLVEYARVNLAEHHSLFYDSTPRPVIDLIVKLTLAGLVVSSEGDSPGFADPRPPDEGDSDAQET